MCTGTLALCYLLPSFTSTGYQSRTTVNFHKRALTLLTIAGIIFRSELALLLATHTIYFLLRRRLSIEDPISAGILGLAIGLSLTVPIDSFFWIQLPIWPELTGFTYNVMEGQSVNWGSQPFHYYFTSAIPRLLLNPATYQICIPFAILTRPLRGLALDLLIPNLAYIAIYSFQPHKEWRFIIYIVPPLTAVAAIGASWIWTRRIRKFSYRVLSLAIIASTLTSFAASFAMLLISRLNYPGAEALDHFHSIAQNGCEEVINVHMDTFTCMTGVTRFLQIPRERRYGGEYVKITYDKTEDEDKLLDPIFWDQFDYVLAERPEKVIGAWEIVGAAEGYAGLKMLKPGEGERDEIEIASMTSKGHGRLDDLGWRLWIVSKKIEKVMRRWITMGYWVRARTETQIRILKKVKIASA